MNELFRCSQIARSKILFKYRLITTNYDMCHHFIGQTKYDWQTYEILKVKYG